MPKMLDGEVDGKQLSIECAVASLGWFELFRKVCDRAPLVFNELLQYSTYRDVRGISHDAGWGLEDRM